MDIATDTVVSFHYTLRDDNGEELESSRGGDPATYLHGHGNIIPGLKDAMNGKATGESFSVTVPAAEAYGERDPYKLQRVPVKHLVYRGKLAPGMVVQLNTEHGLRAVTVLKAGRHSADIDTNHPLAGKALTFDIEVVDVRAASEEEIEHGHVHGPGGHHH